MNDDKPEVYNQIVKHVPISKPIASSKEVEFTPFDHTTAEVPIDPSTETFGRKIGEAPKKEIGYFEGLAANWQDKNETWRLAHGAWDRTEDLIYSYKDPNFNPLNFPDKFENVREEFQPYLLAAENEKQMDFRLNRIYREQWIDDTVKNGSWMQWLSGGALAIPTDLISYIPVIGQMKYARYGKTLVNSIGRNIPGGLAFGLSSSLGEQVDKINGNTKDFLNNTVIRSVFATALFGAGPVVSLTAEKMNLWNLQSYVADAVEGIGYKLKVGEKGEIQGLQAYDMTPNQALSADRIKLAQDKADSAFYKGGLFKVPYIGTAAEKLMSNSFLGSTALSMLLSPFQTVRAVIDLAYDHGITTKGLAEGKKSPTKFFVLMAQTAAHIRQEQNIFNALHAERNGIKTGNYVGQSLQKAGMYTKQKTLEKIGAEIGARPYISEEQFSDEVQQVIRSEVPHENAAVNKAAEMFRGSMDKYYSAWREAYNLPKDWMPPKTAQAYLMRVYDTNFLNNNLNLWNQVIANELRKQDQTILEFTSPITELEEKIAAHKERHRALFENPNAQDFEVKKALEEREALKAQKKALEDKLSNDIRTNPRLHLLADDWNALTANESNELKQITKRRDVLRKEIDGIKNKIAQIETEAKGRENLAMQAATVETGRKNLRKAAIGHLEAERVAQQTELAKVEQELKEEENNLQEMMHLGKINRRFYSQPKDSPIYVLRNPNERLKLRDTYHVVKAGGETRLVDEEEAHNLRLEKAKAYYDTIKNQTAEDTINQIMGHFTGNPSENHIKARTINIPDDVLYDNKFLTKDLLSKVANYKMWLARRTHLQNTYKGLSIDGGFEPVIRNLQEEFDNSHINLNNQKENIQQKLTEKDLKPEEKKKLDKALKQIDFEINKNTKAFNKGKTQVQFAYEKMMGISKLSSRARNIIHSIRSFNVAANLGFLAATMVTDLSANGLKQGLVPFIQSGVYPTIESLGGLLKTHDSESLRHTAGALNLALHHVGGASASRQMDLATNPYLNLGRIPAALDKVAHFASNISLTTYIDNWLQRITSAVAQSNVIRHMKAFEEGKLSKADRMWLNRYGLDPEQDSAAILKAFKKDGGGTNKLGGYQSNFWKWDDIEAANKVSDAVFRSTNDTIISAHAFDVPIWLDENGFLGFMAPIIRGFKGWAFASLNRYLIPSLQTPDAQKLMGFALMTASAALVSPSRRMARGQDPYTDKKGHKMTNTQIIAEILFDSPQFAWMSEALNDANLISGGTLLSDLKNDKYYDRTRIGVMGPAAGNANKLFNFVDALATGNMNEQDAMGMASMIPIVNSLYGYNASQHIIQSFGLPKYRSK